MANDTTLHIKIDSITNDQLGNLAEARNTSKGQLVREAISACYQIPFNELPLAQRQALSAYQGGFISIGRLAVAMGIHVLDLRKWLAERGIEQNTAMSVDDSSRA